MSVIDVLSCRFKTAMANYKKHPLNYIGIGQNCGIDGHPKVVMYGYVNVDGF